MRQQRRAVSRRIGTKRVKVRDARGSYASADQKLLFDLPEGQKETVAPLGYNPTYQGRPFTDFSSVTPETDLSRLNLNWREQDLPERERTKHVHRLHPYLGKFIPQLVEIFLRKFRPKAVCDPFAGSGTTLVEARALGIDSVGCDISAFNCLLTKVKTDTYDLGKLRREIYDSIERLNRFARPSLFSEERLVFHTDSEYLKMWFHPKALNELLCFRGLIRDYEYQDVLKVILSRAARSARLTTHFDLDFPKKPVTEPYECYKHGRICQPTTDALQFLNRYALDTLDRITEFSGLAKKARVSVLHGDVRDLEFPRFDLILTSPPYVGLIDYHAQHRYAYELLDLPQEAEREIGAAFKGSSRTARENYIREIGDALTNLRRYLSRNGHCVIIVNDKEKLYDVLAERLGFDVEAHMTRHVNRRTGRRSNDFFEAILIWRSRD